MDNVDAAMPVYPRGKEETSCHMQITQSLLPNIHLMINQLQIFKNVKTIPITIYSFV